MSFLFSSCSIADRELGLFWIEPSEHPLEVPYVVLAFPLENNMQASWVGGCEELLGQSTSDAL